jgi:hypothetical protein
VLREIRWDGPGYNTVWLARTLAGPGIEAGSACQQRAGARACSARAAAAGGRAGAGALALSRVL